MSEGYTCDVQSYKFASSDDLMVVNVSGTHLTRQSNDDVKYFYSNSVRPLNFFPRHIGKFFKNLRKIYIGGTNISTLSKDDLQFLSDDFRILAIHHAKIRWLEADVFDYTPNLEKVYLRNNQIQYVEKGTLNRLMKLNSLDLQYNHCGQDFASNRSAVLEFITRIEANCTEIPVSFPRELRAEIEAKNSQIENFAIVLKNSAKANQELKAQNGILQQVVETKETKISQLHADLAAERPKNVNKQCYEMSAGLQDLVVKLDRMDANSKARNVQLDTGSVEAKLDSLKLQLDTNKDLLLKRFTSINATCSALDYKLDAINRVSEPCRRP